MGRGRPRSNVEAWRRRKAKDDRAHGVRYEGPAGPVTVRVDPEYVERVFDHGAVRGDDQAHDNDPGAERGR